MESDLEVVVEHSCDKNAVPRFEVQRRRDGECWIRATCKRDLGLSSAAARPAQWTPRRMKHVEALSPRGRAGHPLAVTPQPVLPPPLGPSAARAMPPPGL